MSLRGVLDLLLHCHIRPVCAGEDLWRCYLSMEGVVPIHSVGDRLFSPTLTRLLISSFFF